MELQAPRSDVYEIFVRRMNTPSVAVDNCVCATATLVQVHSARKHGTLLEAVAAMTDLGVTIKKGYVSSDDGRWFMHVFHVTDAATGRKLPDTAPLLARLESSLSFPDFPDVYSPPPPPSPNLTLLELTGADRPGLLSEIFAVLHEFRCSIVDAKAWTHNARIAALVFVRDEDSGLPIDDKDRISRIESKLKYVLKGDDDGARGARMAVADARWCGNVDRRLHQLLSSDRDYERAVADAEDDETPSTTAAVAVQKWGERGYSVVTVSCRDRPKLLFDVVCALTDMDYAVFHGTFGTDGDRAHQEFYLRHLDGSPISSEAERQRVIQCLQAAIERRASEGVRLELRISDRQGLLAYVTRVFRENGLSVTHAEVTTKGEMAVNVFHVTDTAGRPADPKTIDEVIRMIGTESLRVNEELWSCLCSAEGEAGRAGAGAGAGAGFFSLGSLVMRNLYNLGLIRSCS